MTTLWTANLNAGNLTEFASTTVTGTGSTLAANAASAYASADGMDATVTGAGGNSAYASSPSQTVTTSVLSAQCRFKPHLMNVGVAGTVYLLMLHDSGDTVGSQIVCDNNAVYRLFVTSRAGGVQATTLTTQFTIDTWYLIELKADWSGANEVYQVYVNGVLDTTYTDSSVGSNKVYAKVLGGIYTANATSGTVETYTDDYALGDAYIGAGGGVPFEMQQEALAGGFRQMSGGMA